MNLKNIMPQKKASYKGPQIVWFHLHETSRKGKSIETESRLAAADLAGVGLEGEEWDGEGLQTELLEVKKVL